MPRPANKTDYDEKVWIFDARTLTETRSSRPRENAERREERAPLNRAVEEQHLANPHTMPGNENDALVTPGAATSVAARISRTPEMIIEPRIAAQYPPRAQPPPPPSAPPHIRLNAYSGGQWNQTVSAEGDMNNQVYFTFTRNCLNQSCSACCTIHLPTNPPIPAVPMSDIGSDAYVGFGPYPNAPNTLTKCRIHRTHDGHRVLQQVYCYCGLAYNIELTPANVPALAYANNMAGV